MVSKNYRFEAQVAELRKRVPYNPDARPPPTVFPITYHPQADHVCAELDAFFYRYWPWKSEAAREHFLRSEINRWACLAFPLAREDRIMEACRVNTLLFLLDGES